MAPFLSSATRKRNTTSPLGKGSDQDKGVAVAAVAEGISSFEVAIPGSWCYISKAFEQDTASNRSQGFRVWHSDVVN